MAATAARRARCAARGAAARTFRSAVPRSAARPFCALRALYARAPLLAPYPNTTALHTLPRAHQPATASAPPFLPARALLLPRITAYYCLPRAYALLRATHRALARPRGAFDMSYVTYLPPPHRIRASPLGSDKPSGFEPQRAGLPGQVTHAEELPKVWLGHPGNMGPRTR